MFCLSVVLAGILLLGGDAVAEKPDWVYFGTSAASGDHFLYDPKSVTRQPDGVVQVNINKTFKDPSKVTAARAAQGLSTKGWDRLAGIQALWELDCKNGRLATIAEISYDKDGQPLEQRKFEKREWSPISPQSLAHNLQGKVCPDKGKKK
jgi:hypothetical protein